jgi:hypothetical protein
VRTINLVLKLFITNCDTSLFLFGKLVRIEGPNENHPTMVLSWVLGSTIVGQLLKKRHQITINFQGGWFSDIYNHGSLKESNNRFGYIYNHGSKI